MSSFLERLSTYVFNINMENSSVPDASREVDDGRGRAVGKALLPRNREGYAPYKERLADINRRSSKDKQLLDIFTEAGRNHYKARREQWARLEGNSYDPKNDPMWRRITERSVSIPTGNQTFTGKEM